MAQALEKIFLQKVAQMPQEEVELLPPAPKGKGRKPAAGAQSAGKRGRVWSFCPDAPGGHLSTLCGPCRRCRLSPPSGPRGGAGETGLAMAPCCSSGLALSTSLLEAWADVMEIAFVPSEDLRSLALTFPGTEEGRCHLLGSTVGERFSAGSPGALTWSGNLEQRGTRGRVASTVGRSSL